MNDADNADLKLQLREVLGERFTPSSDGIIGSASPENAFELRKLILSTREPGVPLVPRGAGSSPYPGAAAPNGVVLNFERMSHILSVDAQGQLAKVEPGVIWNQLIDHLGTYGLMPRVYPSSAAFSTIGGFVAQSGIGVGSYQYGSIRDCVQSVRMMAGDGEVIELRGDALDLAVGAQGRTGILLEIVLRLQPAATMEPLVAVFDRAADMEGCLAEIAGSALPLWSVSLMDRAAVDLQRKFRAPEFTLPQGRYAALFSFRVEGRQQVLPQLRGAILAAGGKSVPVTGSNSFWLEPFMSLQLLGTTPVPMQFRLPLGKLAELISRIPAGLRPKLALEAVVADRARCTAVRFFLVEAPPAASKDMLAARELLSLVKAVGGAVYATGTFFQDEAEAVHGAPLLGKLGAFRQATDPDDRLNRGKAFAS